MKRVMVSDGKVYVTDDRWVTIGGEDEDGSGQHVLIKENGTIVAGFGKGKNVKNAFGGSEKSSGSKYEAKARESVEYWLKTHYKTESDKNIKESVESVRSQMEYRLKSAEKNLRDAKGTGKPELIKEFQDKYDEAKGMLDALNKYYDGGTVRKVDTPEKANEAVNKAKYERAFKEYQDLTDKNSQRNYASREEWLAAIKKAKENVSKAEKEHLTNTGFLTKKERLNTPEKANEAIEKHIQKWKESQSKKSDYDRIVEKRQVERNHRRNDKAEVDSLSRKISDIENKIDSLNKSDPNWSKKRSQLRKQQIKLTEQRDAILDKY